ncbi:Phosphate transporter PHO1-3 [Acorus calamus]|uniref:Phosphate transporter PHO1-3 n=1 Tax=Acorus calamus TaxID=4465 RepID=A0AAV9DML3_ACOCL|nr:Phosphate transporter PHO1-3 [Acorus calamus]
MVKFSKQFEAQLVPEWKDAFVDYWQLKKYLKKIQNLCFSDTNNPKRKTNSNNSLFSFPLKRLSLFRHEHKDHGLIQVHRKLASSASKGDLYETELLEQFEDTESTKEFFALLDLQLNKVNQFYRGKEGEFVERGESLKKQMSILIELKSKLKLQKAQQSSEAASSRGSNEEDQRKDANEEGDEFQDEELGRPMKQRSLSGRMVSCQGKNVKVNIPLTTPSRTISDLMSQSKPNNINKAKLHRAEKMIKGAFVELYKGLGYLTNYRSLNMMAFVKILKKFDKVTGKEVLPTYMKVVESSCFNSSDKAVKLIDEVEELFVQHFAEDDRRKAMKYLKPNQRKDSHAVTFFIGLFTGCFVALFVGYCIMAHIAGMYTRNSDIVYMETVYPVLSMFSLLFLHLFLYGCNIFMWRKARINYSFIFEFRPTKELKYRDVFLICAASMTAVVGVMFGHLSLVARGYSSAQVHAVPGLLLLAFLVLLICPFDVLYRSSRHHFLRIIRNIILSPLYKVVMVDFFMADQLCSQVPMLRSLEFVTCYYITGSYRNQDYGYCMRTRYRDLAYAVSFLPYYWRAMQCARRWFDEGEPSHLVNLGKYVSAMLAAGAKVAYEKEKSAGWLALVVVVSSAATVYQLYWDFVKDWGLLRFDSKNPWLRNELVLRRKVVYYCSMGLNLVLRLAWLQTVLHYNIAGVDYRVTMFLLASLEVIRRGLWNFFRLENEHLNNAGKFRAVKTIPLPFREVDED